eukprot:446659_1
MGRKAAFKVTDLARVQQLMNGQRTDAMIGETFGCGPRAVYNFRVAHNLPKHTDIESDALEDKLLKLQQAEKQTHGYRTVATELRAQNLRIQQDKIRSTLRKIVPDLVDARNPAKGAHGISKLPLRTAGPLECIHFDQHEKIWKFGFMLYAERARASGYMCQMTVLRNKTPESVFLSFLCGVQHRRGVVSLKAYFDCGTEGTRIHQFYYEHIGSESVIKTTSKQNSPIELSWRLWHDKGEWIFRVEFYTLEMLLLLDVNDPLSISCVWSSYGFDVQWHADYHLSYAINNNKVRKQPKWNKPSRIPTRVIESFYRDLSGRGYMNVFKPNTKYNEYDEYVKDVDQYLQNNEWKSNEDIIRPTEIYLDDFELQTDFETIKGPETLHKSDWSDAAERKIMKGRHHSIGADFLTAKGQHLRDIVVNTILFRLI